MTKHVFETEWEKGRLQGLADFMWGGSFNYDHWKDVHSDEWLKGYEYTMEALSIVGDFPL